MNILIIDQCSKAKSYPEEFTPFDAETLDDCSVEELLDKDNTPAKKAQKLYSGRQQRFISQAVNKLRDAGDSVDRYFVSAGFGVVSEDEYLPPYEVTFTEYSQDEIKKRGESLQIQADVQHLLSRPYDLVFLALGSDYYHAIGLSTILKESSPDTWVVIFNQESIADRFDNVLSLPARTEQAKIHRTIVVALKGKYFQNFAEYRSHGVDINSIDEVEQYCISEYRSQSGLSDFE